MLSIRGDDVSNEISFIVFSLQVSSFRSMNRLAEPAGRRFKPESFIVHGGACRMVLIENLLEVSPYKFGSNIQPIIPLLLDVTKKLLLILARQASDLSVRASAAQALESARTASFRTRQGE